MKYVRMVSYVSAIDGLLVLCIYLFMLHYGRMWHGFKR